MKSESRLGRELFRIIVILIGVALDAAGVNFFMLPYDIPVGGITGISRIINHFVSTIPISVGVACLSVLMLIIGYVFVGKSFVAKTLLGSITYPLFLAIFEQIDPAIFTVDDRLLASTFAGILMGVGLGLCVRNGSSTGGTDLLGVVINKQFKVPVATVTYCIDAVVLLIQMTFGNFEDILYGVYILILTAIVMNKAITIGSSNVQMFIISGKHKEINATIQEQENLGSTLLHGCTGRFGTEQDVILCTTKAETVRKVRDLVYDIDESAFITMMNVSEVYGRGYSMDRILRDPDNKWQD